MINNQASIMFFNENKTSNYMVALYNIGTLLTEQIRRGAKNKHFIWSWKAFYLKYVVVQLTLVNQSTACSSPSSLIGSMEILSISSESLFSFQQLSTCDVQDVLHKIDVKKNIHCGSFAWSFLVAAFCSSECRIITIILNLTIIPGTIPRDLEGGP